MPATLYIVDTSSPSAVESSGSIVGMRFAIIVFPEPGGPIIRKWWKPAAATSTARFTASCPFMSAKSNASFALSVKSTLLHLAGGIKSRFCSSSAFKYSTASISVETPIISMSAPSPIDLSQTIAPSLTFSVGTMQRFILPLKAQFTIGSTPFIRFTSPFSPSSPTISVLLTFSLGITPMLTSIPIAIGKS